MNVLNAKNQIKNTVEMYLKKDEFGAYVVDNERQRPIFLIGAPGIGKTAIVGEVAKELNVGFVSYTITHHTRQSAIGLPFITKKTFRGKEYSVTEYTLSEIIASVYQAIEVQEKKEGILFIDEINCVSETLAPAMLELLQNKRFGPHKIPEGWILVSAGNPLEYNKSVRDFDVVTLDRVKKIEVTPDYGAFKKYAKEKLICPAVTYYLAIKPEKLFVMQKTPYGFKFVTPRGWEDLSVAIKEYLELGFDVTLELITQYVQDDETATEFYRYYCLFQKYNQEYGVEEIIVGRWQDKVEKMKTAVFDEKFAITEVLTWKLSAVSKKVNLLSDALEKIKTSDKEKTEEFIEDLKTQIIKPNLTKDEKRVYNYLLKVLEDCGVLAQQKIEEKLNTEIEELNLKTQNVFAFIKECFGLGQEMTALLIGLISDVNFVTFAYTFGCDVFYEYNSLVMLDTDNAELKEQIKSVLKKG